MLIAEGISFESHKNKMNRNCLLTLVPEIYPLTCSGNMALPIRHGDVIRTRGMYTTDEDI